MCASGESGLHVYHGGCSSAIESTCSFVHCVLQCMWEIQSSREPIESIEAQTRTLIRQCTHDKEMQFQVFVELVQNKIFQSYWNEVFWKFSIENIVETNAFPQNISLFMKQHFLMENCCVENCSTSYSFEFYVNPKYDVHWMTEFMQPWIPISTQTMNYAQGPGSVNVCCISTCFSLMLKVNMQSTMQISQARRTVIHN